MVSKIDLPCLLRSGEHASMGVLPLLALLPTLVWMLQLWLLTTACCIVESQECIAAHTTSVLHVTGLTG